MLLKKLRDKADGLVSELEAIQVQIADGVDAPEGKTWEEELSAKSVELDGVLKQIKGAQALAESKRVVESIRADSEPDAKGKTLADPPEAKRDAAQPTDRESDQREIRRGFAEYCQGKTIADRMREALAPKSKSGKFGKEASDGVVLPDTIAAAIMGGRWAKAMGYTDRMAREYAGKVGTSGTAAYAGNLVPSQDLQAMLLQLAPEPTSILGMATVVPCPYGTLTWPRLQQTDSNEYGGVSISWISEGASKTESDPTFQQITITTHELAAYTEVSHTLLRRSILDLEQILSTLYRDALQSAMETAFLSGTGTGQPTGVVNEAGIRTVNRAGAGAVAYADLVNLKHALQPYHRANAKFMLHDGVEGALELLTDTQNRPLFNSDVSNGPYTRLVGYPYIVTERQPTLGSDGDVIFGDWRQYIVPMEQEVVVKRSSHYKFQSNLESFTVHAVVGGRLAIPRAMAILSAGTS